MERINTTEVRNNFADILNRVAYGKEQIVLHRRGKDVVAVIPMKDFSLLSKLSEEKKSEINEEGFNG